MPSRKTSQGKMLIWGSERWQSGLMRRLLESRHADDTASGVQIPPLSATPSSPFSSFLAWRSASETSLAAPRR
jgi:hypothetical protein